MTRKPIILLILFFLSACSKPAVELQILDNIEIMQSAIEAKKPHKVMSYIAEDFEALHQIDRKRIKHILLAQLLKHENVSVNLSTVIIKLDPLVPGRATMNTTVVLTGTSGWIPEDGRIYQVQGEWRLQGEEWKLIKLT